MSQSEESASIPPRFETDAQEPFVVLGADGAIGGLGAWGLAGESLPAGALDRVFSTYRAIQASESDVDEVLRLTVHNAQALLRADLSSVWRPTGRLPSGRGVVSASVGHQVESWAAELAPDQTGIGRVCLDLGCPVLVVDYRAYADRAAPPVTPFLAWSEAAATVLCLPLREGGDEAAGVLYVARRRLLPFGPAEIELAAALAGQAALALRNGRLRRELQEQHALVEHSARVAARLSRAAVDAGVDGLRRALERDIGRRVDYVPASDGELPGVEVAPVVAGRERYGDLHVYGRPLNPADAVSVQQATSLLAQEMARERALKEARVRTGAQLLGSLLDGVGVTEAHIAERARRIGFDLRRPVVVVAVAHTGAELPALHASATTGGIAVADVLVAEGPDCALLAVAAPEGWTPDAAVDSLLARPDVRCAGVSARRPEIVGASRTALACLSLAREAPNRRAVSVGDLGPLEFLLGAADAVTQLQRNVSDVLGAVQAAERRGGAPLLASLDAYLSSGRRLAIAADRLGTSESTLKYRLTRVRGLVGGIEGSHAFDLWLALRARAFLTHLGHACETNAGS
ncbi:hypothetical protein DSM112329_02044 [Paraconexibacter sp. AEG42_29]|uniref:GAF domain-containing protein n=1 Tax=Paraconexibacter sp. AEG42_29 TaxID=2997339 RepID=A0AAU7AV17_9ACTN